MLLTCLKRLIRLYSLTNLSIISCLKYDTYLSSELSWAIPGLDVSAFVASRAHDLCQRELQHEGTVCVFEHHIAVFSLWSDRVLATLSR